MQYIRLINWEEYQHYKDRSAPWIKLHGNLLTSHFWIMGNDASKLLAICLMMLAQRTSNKIPHDLGYIQKFSHLSISPDISQLIEYQFIELIDENNASIMLADCLQLAPRGEERRGEERSAKKSARQSQIDLLVSLGVNSQHADDWLKVRTKKRASEVNQTVIEGIMRECGKAGFSFADAIRMCAERGWQGFNSDWLNNSGKGGYIANPDPFAGAL